MNNHVSFDLSLQEPLNCWQPVSHRTDDNGRMSEIRRTSNIIQALENVLIQSEDNSDYEWMRKSILGYLEFSRKRMLNTIHQP